MSATSTISTADIMPEMSLSDAAKWTGKTRPTIHKALTSGRLSGRQDDKGHWHIDPAELERVYPIRKPVDVSGDRQLSKPDTGEETAAHERETALLRELVEAARQDAAEARRERDDWKEQAGKWEREAEAVRLLTHQKAPPEDSQVKHQTPAAPPAPRGLRARLASWISPVR